MPSRAISPVIASLLLIVTAIAAIVITYAFVLRLSVTEVSGVELSLNPENPIYIGQEVAYR